MFIFFMTLFFLSIIAFVIGLIKPSVVKMISRKKVLLVGSSTIVVLFILLMITVPPLTDAEKADIEERKIAKEETKLAKEEEKQQTKAEEKEEQEAKELEKEKKQEEEELKKEKEQEEKEKEKLKKEAAETQEKKEAEKAEKEKEEAAKKEQAKKDEANKKAKAKKEKEAKQPESIVKAAVKDAFGEDSIDKINYNEDNRFVLIRVHGNDNLTTNMIKTGMWIDTADVLEDLKNADGIDTIDFNIMFPMEDQYGEGSDDIIMKLSFDKGTRKKINWDNFLHKNIPNISDNYWEHPAFRK